MLPPTTRTISGYRRWDDSHVASLLAYQQLTGVIGPVEARLLVRDAHRDQTAIVTRRRVTSSRSPSGHPTSPR